MKVTLVDYGVGNVASVRRAFARLGTDVELTPEPERVAAARRIVLPGVGAFAPARGTLRETGLDEALRAAVSGGARLLGLCLGFQLLFDESEEHGVTEGLCLLRGRVRPFPAGVRTPHVGWNRLRKTRPGALLASLAEGSWVYFVHSFRPEEVEEGDVAATSQHGGEFPAAVEKGNVWGCQFHPEKPSEAGRLILGNFLGGER